MLEDTIQKEIESLIGLNSSNVSEEVDKLTRLGDIYLRRFHAKPNFDDLIESITCWSTIITDYEGNDEIHEKIGISLQKAQQVLDHNKGSTRMYLFYAGFLSSVRGSISPIRREAVKHYKKAIRYYEELLELDPESRAAHRNISKVLFDLGQRCILKKDKIAYTKLAIQRIEGSEEGELQTLRIANWYSRLYEYTSDEQYFKKAEEKYNFLISKKQENGRVYFKLGTLYLISASNRGLPENEDLALHYWEIAREFNGLEPEIYTNLGILYERRGQRVQALANYLSAYIRAPEDEDNSRNLERALRSFEGKSELVTTLANCFETELKEKNFDQYAALGPMLAIALEHYTMDGSEEVYETLARALGKDKSFFKTLKKMQNQSRNEIYTSSHPILGQAIVVKHQNEERRESEIHKILTDTIQKRRVISRLYGKVEGKERKLLTISKENQRSLEEVRNEPHTEKGILKALDHLAYIHCIMADTIEVRGEEMYIHGRQKYVKTKPFDYIENLTQRGINRLTGFGEFYPLSEVFIELHGAILSAQGIERISDSQFYIHGDVFPSNVLENGTIIDFELNDQGNIGDPLYDVAYLLSHPMMNRFDITELKEYYWQQFIEYSIQFEVPNPIKASSFEINLLHTTITNGLSQLRKTSKSPTAAQTAMEYFGLVEERCTAITGEEIGRTFQKTMYGMLKHTKQFSELQV